MISLRTDTGKHFVQVLKMWLKVFFGKKPRFFQSMIALEESGRPQTSPLPNPGRASEGEVTFIQKMKGNKNDVHWLKTMTRKGEDIS